MILLRYWSPVSALQLEDVDESGACTAALTALHALTLHKAAAVSVGHRVHAVQSFC